MAPGEDARQRRDEGMMAIQTAQTSGMDDQAGWFAKTA
jgi:hypothetical protein